NLSCIIVIDTIGIEEPDQNLHDVAIAIVCVLPAAAPPGADTRDNILLHDERNLSRAVVRGNVLIDGSPLASCSIKDNQAVFHDPTGSVVEKEGLRRRIERRPEVTERQDMAYPACGIVGV